MNRQEQNPPPRQTTLPLAGEAQWEQLPQDVRNRCRELLAQLLSDLSRTRGTGDKNER